MKIKQLIIASLIVVCFFTSCASAEILENTGYHFGMLELTLDQEYFIGKTAEETIGNVKVFIDDIGKIDGLENINIVNIQDNNLQRSIDLYFYAKYWDKDMAGQMKDELEKDPLVGSIAVCNELFSIKLKKQTYYYDEIKNFIERHPKLIPVVPLYCTKLVNISVCIEGISKNKEKEYGELLKDRFPQKIKETNLLFHE